MVKFNAVKSIAANVAFKNVVRVLVMTGMSVAAATAMVTQAFAQVHTNNSGNRGNQIQNTQHNPAVTGAECSTAVTASDFAPVNQIGTNPPATVVDPASSAGQTLCNTNNAHGGEGGDGGNAEATGGHVSDSGNSESTSVSEGGDANQHQGQGQGQQQGQGQGQSLQNQNSSNSGANAQNGNQSVDASDNSSSTYTVEDEREVYPATLIPGQIAPGTSGQTVDLSVACPTSSVAFSHQVFAANEGNDTRGSVGLPFLNVQGGHSTTRNGDLPAAPVSGNEVVLTLQGVRDGSIVANNCDTDEEPPVTSQPPATVVPPVTEVPPTPPTTQRLN